MKRILALTMLVATFLLGAEQARAALIIDNFLVPGGGGQTATAFKNGPVTSSVNVGGLNGADVLGTSREIQVHYANPQTGANQSIVGSANGLIAHAFDFTQSTNAQGTATILYDGHANGSRQAMGLNTLFPPHGVDLTQGGLDTGLLINNLRTYGNNLKIEVNLYSGVSSGIWSTGVLTLPNTNGALTHLFLNYATAFSGGGGSSTPTHVGAIEIFIDGRFAPGAHMSFGQISSTSVPEPATLAGGLIGGLGLLGFARRRARKAAR